MPLPTVICHHLHALDAARRSLDDMLRPHQLAYGKPTRHTFSTVLSAYGRAERVEEAEGLLTIMEDFAESTADPNVHRMPSASMPLSRSGPEPEMPLGCRSHFSSYGRSHGRNSGRWKWK